MKLLFIIPYTPSLIRSRPYNFLKYLAQRGHHITLATLHSGEEDRHALTEIAGWGIEVIAEPLGRMQIIRNLAEAVAAGLPLQARFSWNPRLAGRIRDVQADVVHVEHLRGALYGTYLLDRVRPRPPVVWDSVDSISHLFAQAAEMSRSPFGRFVSRLELQRTRRYEGRMTARFDRVVVTSEMDRKALEGLAGAAARGREPVISVVGQAVDQDLFHPIDEPVQPDTIIFTGKMSYHANVTAVVEFARQVMPAIWDRRPGVKLLVVGKDPDRQVRALAADRRIEVLGMVPELRQYLGRAAVAVAPIVYGAGVQNKVLEAMACRTPVVASPRAVASLAAVPGHDVLVAEDPTSFAASALRLLEDARLRDSVANSGYQFVTMHHRWEQAVQKLEDVYHGAIQSVG